MSEHSEVLIIGGGVIGLTTAYFLGREGARVGVVDQGDLGQEASWAGAGILPPLGKLSGGLHPYQLLRLQSADLYAPLSAELRERTGIDNGYQRSGGLELTGRDPAVEQQWRTEGVSFETVDEPAMKRLEPALAAGLGHAYFLPHIAQLRNPRHVKALVLACQGLGVELRAGCPCRGFDRSGSRITGLKSDGETLRADRYLIAAGAWTDGLLEPLGCRPGVRPVRGQIALLQTSPPLLARVVLEGKRYLVPRADGRVLVGSTEEDAGFDKRTTACAIGDLLALAQRLAPGLAHAHLERCWAGLRPASPDGLPFLGPVPGLDNLLVAAGHFRAGISLAPATALVMKELVLGQLLTVPLEAFRLDRKVERY
jgi:glycine oxidase